MKLSIFVQVTKNTKIFIILGQFEGTHCVHIFKSFVNERNYLLFLDSLKTSQMVSHILHYSISFSTFFLCCVSENEEVANHLNKPHVMSYQSFQIGQQKEHNCPFGWWSGLWLFFTRRYFTCLSFNNVYTIYLFSPILHEISEKSLREEEYESVHTVESNKETSLWWECGCVEYENLM